MAYATRFYFEFVSENDIEYRIDIKQDGYEGEPVQRSLGGDPVLRRDKSGNILGTSLEFLAECQVEGEFSDLYALDAYEYMVELRSGDSLLFTGFLTPESYAEPDIAPPYDIHLTATDCLGELKGYDFEGSENRSVSDVLIDILAHTGIEKNIWISSSLIFNGGSFVQGVWSRVYTDWSWLTGKTEYEVLQMILASLNAKLIQFGSVWWIIRETDLMSFYNVSNTTGVGAYNLVYGGDPAPPGGDTRVPAPHVGSMDDTDWWPIGNLDVFAEPAMRAVTIYARNVYKDNILSGDWSGVTPVDGVYSLDEDDAIAKTVSFTYSLAEPTVLSFVAGNRSPRTSRRNVVLQVQVKRVGETYHGDSATEYLRKVDDEYRWGTSAASVEVTLPYDDTEDPQIEIEIPFAIPEAGARVGSASVSKVTSLEMSISCDDDSAEISDIVLYDTLAYNGMKDEVIIQNGAREKADDVQIIFSSPAGSQYVRESQVNFISNLPKNQSGVYRDSWKDGGDDYTSFIEVIGIDYARAIAAPRWRASGKLNVPVAGSVPVYFEFRTMLFFLETFRWNLLEDELEIDMLSVPVVTVEAESIITSGLPGTDNASQRSGSHSGNTVNVTVARVTRTAYEVWLDAGYIGTYDDFLLFIQGNSGYQGAAGELEVVNSFAGGPEKALSAEMGKQLKAQLDYFRENLPAIREVEVSGDGNVVTEVDVDPDDSKKLVVKKNLSAMKSVALSYAEYRELIYNNATDPKTWYCIYSDAAPYPLMRVYIGDTLLASRDSGSAGFAYNFPISF